MHGNKGGNACVGGFIYLFIFNGLHKNILLLVSWINTVKYLIFFKKSLLLLYFLSLCPRHHVSTLAAGSPIGFYAPPRLICFSGGGGGKKKELSLCLLFLVPACCSCKCY